MKNLGMSSLQNQEENILTSGYLLVCYDPDNSSLEADAQTRCHLPVVQKSSSLVGSRRHFLGFRWTLRLFVPRALARGRSFSLNQGPKGNVKSNQQRDLWRRRGFDSEVVCSGSLPPLLQVYVH